jgi:hypothetical protein
LSSALSVVNFPGFSTQNLHIYRVETLFTLC